MKHAARIVPWSEIPPDDPIVVAQIERALAPYRGVLPQDALEMCEELLEMVLTTHPEIAPRVDRLRRSAAVQRSEIRPVQEPPRDEVATPRGARRRSGGRR